MGGQTCFQLAVRDPQRYRGVILYAPAIKDLESEQRFAKFLVNIIGYIAPTMPTVTGRGGNSSKNPYVDESYRNDP
jgi:pimeloyl-ACP methyl ester carboxylesterase